jgi:hypothetical protein
MGKCSVLKLLFLWYFRKVVPLTKTTIPAPNCSFPNQTTIPANYSFPTKTTIPAPIVLAKPPFQPHLFIPQPAAIPTPIIHSHYYRKY